MSENIVQRERRFHNERFSQAIDPRAGLNKWYASVRHGPDKQNALVRQYAQGKSVLEYGCADGGLSIDELNLPAKCHSLTGIDISDVAIQKARSKVATTGITNARF